MKRARHSSQWASSRRSHATRVAPTQRRFRDVLNGLQDCGMRFADVRAVRSLV
jgi:hypothetical protein